MRRVQVDANGRPIPNPRLKDSKPVSGQRLRLSLDLGLEQAGANAIAGPLNPGSKPGAFLAMDPRDGQLLAMGSFPTFDPAIFTKPITKKRYDALIGGGDDDGPGPIFNRAIAGGYPVASTMKAITALAGLDAGLITPATTIDDAGCIKVGEIDRCNANEAAVWSRRPHEGARWSPRTCTSTGSGWMPSTAATSPARRSSSSAGRAGSASTAPPGSTCRATSTATARSPIRSGATRSTAEEVAGAASARRSR